MDRNAKILSRIRRNMRILEMGPSFAPIVPKSDGWNVLTLDHATKEKIMEKYAGIGVPPENIAKIEDVDFVWTGGSILDCIPEKLYGSFDAIIASHVLEHIPNAIGFMKAASILLNENGVLSLANPDKRFTFDYLRPLTTSADMLEAYYEDRSNHTAKSIFSVQFNSVTNNSAEVWGTWIPLEKL